MNAWWKRVRGIAGMGLTWAIAWALVGGFIMEGMVDPHGRILDMWPQPLAIAGFVGGVSFAVVTWAAERRRRFDQLSLARFGMWGAAVGLLMGSFAVASGMGSTMLPLAMRIMVIVTPLTVFSALSAAGTLAMARRASPRTLHAATADNAALGLACREDGR